MTTQKQIKLDRAELEEVEREISTLGAEIAEIFESKINTYKKTNQRQPRHEERFIDAHRRRGVLERRLRRLEERGE
jgi:uncharacterized membrane-anchored protein YhcB (DUF1043 family)